MNLKFQVGVFMWSWQLFQPIRTDPSKPDKHASVNTVYIWPENVWWLAVIISPEFYVTTITTFLQQNLLIKYIQFIMWVDIPYW